MPPRPLRLPFYRNGGGAGDKPAPLAVIWWQASRRGHRVRSAGSDPHAQLRGAHHHGPRAELSSPRPGHSATRGPASSADQPTSAPPARRPPQTAHHAALQRVEGAERAIERVPGLGMPEVWGRSPTSASTTTAGTWPTRRSSGTPTFPPSVGPLKTRGRTVSCTSRGRSQDSPPLARMGRSGATSTGRPATSHAAGTALDPT